MLQNPLETLRDLTKKHAGIVELRILHKKFIVVEDPDYFRYILQYRVIIELKGKRAIVMKYDLLHRQAFAVGYNYRQRVGAYLNG